MNTRRQLLVGAGLVLAVSAVVAPSRADAAGVAGTARIVDPGARGDALASGNRATAFTLGLPKNAGCRGDSADDGYRVQSYMIPASVDPGTLSFGSTGPQPRGTGAAFRQPLYNVTSTPYVNEQTANVDVPGDSAAVVSIPAFDLAVFGDGEVPVGAYNIGLACTKGSAAATTIDRFWNARLTVTASSTAAGLAWTAGDSDAASSSASPSANVATGASAESASASSETSPASSGSARTARSAGTEPAPSGAPPSFDVPAFGLIEWPRLGAGSGVSMAVWFVVLSAFIRIAATFVRKFPLRPVSVR